MCGKCELWSLHYQHGNVLRDQVTPHVLIFSLRILRAGWKVLSKYNRISDTPTLKECFLVVKWQKNRYISSTTWPGHVFQLVSCTSRYAWRLPRVICYYKCAQVRLQRGWSWKVNWILWWVTWSLSRQLSIRPHLSLRLSSHVSFVSIRCIFTETDHPPSIFLVFFTYFRWASP